VGLLRDGGFVAVGTPDGLIAAHGGDSRLLIGVDGSADGGAVATTLDADVDEHDDALVVRGVALADVGDVVADLEAAGVTLDSFQWAEPGLEDVYLRLTGEAFDGEGGSP
jgi:ABC-2 type transport system ATP-binding protein